ncbi:MAG: flagellin [Desulfobacterales bacterium]|nr:flagellin [Desulfobacterales bacterium]
MATTGNISLTAGMRKNLMDLQSTASLMDKTSTRLSTGKKVNTALDDPVNYFAALSHENRASDLAFRKDAMNESVQMIKAADNGIRGIMTLIESAKATANSALATDSVAATQERSDLSAQFNRLMDQIDFLADDSGYNGTNLINSSSLTLDVKFDEDGTSKVTLTAFSAKAGGGVGTGLGISDAVAANWTNTTQTTMTGNIESAVNQLNTAITTLRTQSKNLANQLSTINARQEFTKNMINTLHEGAGNLTLADMNEEGANMLMLQTRQSLGTTALSMASQAAQAVMRLF